MSVPTQVAEANHGRPESDLSTVVEPKRGHPSRPDSNA
jgi:hypothetical protein